MPDKILVVDDEPGVVQLCLRILSPQGYSVQGCTSGQEAIALLQTELIDLLVVDIKMPDVDGLTVLRRGRELYPDLAAVVITGFATLSSAVEALHAGAHRFVLKPFGVEELTRAVQETLEQRHKEQERLRLRAQLPILEIAQALLVEGDTELLAQQLLEPVARELGADQSALLVLDAETDELYIAGVVGGPADAIHMRIPATTAFLEQLRHGTEAIVEQNQPYLQRFLPAAPDARLATTAYVPLRTVKRLIGALCLGRPQAAAPFIQSDLGLLTIIGGQIATALENAHLYAVVARGNREWEETFDAIADGISIHDAEFRVLRANRALAERLGLAPREVIGRRCYELVHGTPDPPAFCPAALALTTGQPQTIEWELSLLGGTFQCVVYPLYDRTAGPQGFVHVLRDITEHKRAEETLRRRNEELTALNAIAATIGQTHDLDHILNATLDQVLELTEMDGGWIQLLDEKTGTLPPVVHRNIPAVMVEELSQVRLGQGLTGTVAQSGQPYLADGQSGLPLLREESRHEGVQLSISIPIRSQDRVLGVLALFSRGSRHLVPHHIHTLTAIGHQLGVAVENARLARETAEVKVLRELDRLRSELTANVSHELRTPLGLIKILASTLLRQDMALDEATHCEFLENISDEAGRLEKIVDNLLDLSHIESGRFCLERTPTDLGPLVRETIAVMAVSSAQHRLVCDLPAEPLEASVDRERVGQVLRNLLDNALKYSPAGGTITIRGRPVEEGLLIQVTDEGIGIPPEDRERVFERFYRVPNEITMRERGAGLGLSVCKGIVEAHGGRIWVESTPGQGCTFSFTLPGLKIGPSP